MSQRLYCRVGKLRSRAGFLESLEAEEEVVHRDQVRSRGRSRNRKRSSGRGRKRSNRKRIKSISSSNSSSRTSSRKLYYWILL